MSDISIDNERVFSANFLDAVKGSQDGLLKTASAAATEMTRRVLREDRFCAAIMPFAEISDDQLDSFLEMEDPAIIYEMEPAIPGAMTISNENTANSVTFRGDKYLLTFHTNSTPEWVKDVNLLRSYKTNVRQVVIDNSLRDLSRQADVDFMAGTNKICGSVPGGVSPVTGLEQFVVYDGRLTRDTWVNCQQLLPDRRLQNGVFLCNRRTFSEFQRWTRNEIGGDFSEKLFLEGSGAFDKATVSGITFIVTMKNDLVGNGEIYEYTKPNFLGHAGVLEKPTMYVKKDKDILRFSCREKIGMVIANTAGVQKVRFKAIQDTTGGDGRLSVAEATA